MKGIVREGLFLRRKRPRLMLLALIGSVTHVSTSVHIARVLCARGLSKTCGAVEVALLKSTVVH